MTTINAAFQWEKCPLAENLLEKALSHCLKNPFLKHLQGELKRGCSTGLLEWVDHIVLPLGSPESKELEKAGYKLNGDCYVHPGAQLPKVKLGRGFEVALSVDSIADFLMVRGLSFPIDGSILSGYRRCIVSDDQGIKVAVIERRGVEGDLPIHETGDVLRKVLEAKEKWMTRSRSFEIDDEKAFKQAISLAEEFAESLGKNRAACLVLECERAFWQHRNRAGSLQKGRQDRVGMGWANHDHHTFRSSRKHFMKLVKLFETLGFHCRERFYAGEEAGWGAQVMENPIAKLVLFLDVDLSPEEIGIDFAHHNLPLRHELGTIGLWCALHGDSILQAGMHHLEAQFEFDALANDLLGAGIQMMEPFSNFSYLKQAFTQGEVWPVSKIRIDQLKNEGKITDREASKFLAEGAVGSHLENLQRKEGYKGFNQKNVSFIIKKTDPRHVTIGPHGGPQGLSDG